MMSLIKLSHLLEIHNNSCDEESVGIFALRFDSRGSPRGITRCLICTLPFSRRTLVWIGQLGLCGFDFINFGPCLHSGQSLLLLSTLWSKHIVVRLD